MPTRKIVISEVASAQLPGGFELASFGVSSLFPMVPVQEVTLLPPKLVKEQNIIPDWMDEGTFHMLLVTSDVLLLNPSGQFFRQKDGVEMGSIVVPYMAYLFLSQYDETVKEKSTIFYRYMDDV